jgi:hypothetical protein
VDAETIKQQLLDRIKAEGAGWDALISALSLRLVP